jgi:alpha-amylase
VCIEETVLKGTVSFHHPLNSLPMTSVCLYFKVHQPYRLKKYQPGDIDIIHSYDDTEANKTAIDFAADNCYLPANEIIFNALKKHKGKFKVSFSISGTALELLQEYRPDVIDSIKQLTNTGCVEILAETYYHSLSFLHSKKEFQRQVEKHAASIKEILGIEPAVFRNTELIYNNELAKFISTLGYKGILCEGVERILRGRTANKLYAAPNNGDFALLLRNTNLSDDIAFRFNDSSWSEHPLTADKFADWLHAHPENTDVINLFMDYETFGIHKKEGSGIFEFLDALPDAVLANNNFRLSTPSEVLQEYYPADIYEAPYTISWDDKADVSCVWCENMMQNNSLKKIYSIEKMITASDCGKTIDVWGRLQAADNFYYMTEKERTGHSFKYPNPFTNGAEAFQNYNNILVDFEISVIRASIERIRKKKNFTLPVFNLY